MIFRKNREFLTHSQNRSTLSEEKFLRFTKELKIYLTKIPQIENEESGKTPLKNLIFSTGYDNHNIEPDRDIDLAIWEDVEKSSEKQIEVFIETKIPNSKEMVTDSDFRKKAFSQILYYFSQFGTSALKHLIVTDYRTLYLFKAKDIETVVKSKAFPKFRKGKSTKDIYSDIEKTDLPSINYTKFDFSVLTVEKVEEIEQNLYSKEDTVFNLKRELTALYKLFSPENLLELNFGKDMNRLDDGFYNELLHIFGVEERKDSDGIVKILRKKEGERDSGSILELTLSKMKSRDFDEAFKLNVIWLNRILFIKLLEARLNFMHPNFKLFMNSETISEFDELNELFFGVMAEEFENRDSELREKFKEIPYMNSSLFESKEIEEQLFDISKLSSSRHIELLENSVLDSESSKLKTLDYLFQFLNSYDFGSNKFDEVAKVDRTLIKSSVLGLIFEKVNGYRDGSHFTPSFITTKLAKDSLENYLKNSHFESVEKSLKNIRVLDPSVGSGHILVSVMNELVVRQAVLEDDDGNSRKLSIENDEIFIADEVQYIANGDGIFPSEAKRIQRKMFHLKKRIIENNLFGVDINSSSVEIARLRLWIELLKWSYYDGDGKFTVLPNLDINISVGNSLISRFRIKDSLKESEKEKASELNSLTTQYFKELDKGVKRGLDTKIKKIRAELITQFLSENSRRTELATKIRQYQSIYGKIGLEELKEKYKIGDEFVAEKPKKTYKKELKKLEELDTTIELFENLKESFEWRFQFPKVLNENGDFIGFDLIVGNPPYIRHENLKADDKRYFKSRYLKTFNNSADIYTYFYELGLELLKTDGGILSYITSNSWLTAKYGQNLRKTILKDTRLLQYIDYKGIKNFTNATVDTSITSFTNSLKGDKTLQYCNATAKKVIENGEKKREFSYSCYSYSMDELSENGFSFMKPKELAIKKRIEDIGTPLKEWNLNINSGIKTGFNEAFIIDTEKRNEILDNCTSSEEREKTEKIIRKVLRGRDIAKYSYKWVDQWIIYLHSEIEEFDYPAIREHLLQFKEKLESRTGGANPKTKETPYDWWQLQVDYFSSGTYLEFEKEKIAWIELSDENKFILDTKGHFLLNTTYLLTSEIVNPRYILSLLNSKLIKYYFHLIADSSGAGTKRWIRQKFELIPIPKSYKQLYSEYLSNKRGISSDSLVFTDNSFDRKTELCKIIKQRRVEKELIDLVNQVLEKKAKHLDTTDLENQIDQIVYRLYGLTPDEVQIIES
jgi:type II restriction/modification system DNA methylase subunit YeeA